MAEDFGFTYYGGSNPLADVTAWQAAPTFVDIDNDGDMDCFIGDVDGYIGYWNNKGSAESPEFIQITGEGNPFSNTCVNDWAAPAFVDIDGDGDMDAFIGHFKMLHQAWDGGSGADSIISFFENTGTPSNPVFDCGVISNSRKTASLDYNPLILTGTYEAVPTFVDIDGDGDMDAFVGDYNGSVWGFENTTIDGNEEPLKKGPFTGTIGFQNLGPMSAYLTDQTYGYIDAYGDEFGGSATPAFVDADGDGDYDLFVGNKYGTIQYYENTGSKTSYSFTERTKDDNPLRMSRGAFCNPAFVDIDADGKTDLFTGGVYWKWDMSRKGGDSSYAADFTRNTMVRFYKNVGTDQAPDWRSRGDNPFNLGPDYKTPAFALGDVDGDGDADAVVARNGMYMVTDSANKLILYGGGQIKYYENTGPLEDPVFAFHSWDDAAWGAEGDWHMPAPAIADLNGDGFGEVYMGYTQDYAYNSDPSPITGTGAFDALGYVTETMSFEYCEMNPLAELGDLPPFPHAAFVDVDGDGDLDLFVAGSTYYSNYDNPAVSFFRNEGTAITPSFKVISDSNPLACVLTAYTPILNFADVDGDGDMDAVLSDRYGGYVGGRKNDAPDWGPRYFTNAGSATAPEFVEKFNDANPFNEFKKKTLPGAVVLADLDNDQDPDAVMADYYGKMYYYRNIETVDEAMEIVKHNDDWLCFVEGARSESSLWERMTDSCKQGAQKVREFFAPSKY